MKFSTIFAAAFAATAQAISVSFDEGFDQPTNVLTGVTCSDGQNGLITRYHWSLYSDIPRFPFIGGFDSTGWDSPNCGACHSLTYNGNTIYVLAIDNAQGANIAKQAFTALTGNPDLGRVEAETAVVDASNCGL